jgi:S1-C subfamily serine protease
VGIQTQEFFMTASNPNVQSLSQSSEALADAVEHVGRSVVAVHAGRHGTASGVLWRDGVVVTTAHTIRREDGIRITLPDGTRRDAALAGVDPSTDLAALKVDSEWPDLADIGDSATVRTGHFVFAAARDAQGQASASFGVVGAVGTQWRTWRGGDIDRLIRLDGRLYAGYSGCPVADMRGQIIGIGTSALSRDFGVAIPSSTVSRVIEQLLTSGRIAHGYLGVGMQSVALPQSLSSKLGLGNRDGLIVLSLAPQGPAEQAGVLVGDILIELGGKPLHDVADLHSALGSDRIGERIRVGLVRGGERIDSAITLSERPRSRC